MLSFTFQFISLSYISDIGYISEHETFINGVTRATKYSLLYDPSVPRSTFWSSDYIEKLTDFNIHKKELIKVSHSLQGFLQSS